MRPLVKEKLNFCKLSLHNFSDITEMITMKTVLFEHLSTLQSRNDKGNLTWIMNIDIHYDISNVRIRMYKHSMTIF